MVGASKKNFLNFLNLIAKQIKTEVNVNIFQTKKKLKRAALLWKRTEK